ncbi:hypothetical protein [Pseudomonas sichuanensis]|uniref:hypothetical protein n=1 Tax=Pseudomonas sichuanensis TaxID=2213015 RepID=UPI002B4136EA|nr:hypothetical protein [Pseudomonas sichuanensis]
MSGEAQLADFLREANAFGRDNGSEILGEFDRSASLLLAWIKLLKNNLTGTADELLAAVLSAVREAAAFAAVGAIRPALFSLRAQPDLLLSWIYFKDHPVEYSSLCRTGDNYVLKKEAVKYMADNYEGFGSKIGVLNQVVGRTQLDPYRLLSAHIHSQSPFVINQVDRLEDIIQDKRLALECAKVQAEVSEYLSDIVFSLGIYGGASLPRVVKDNLRARVKTDGQRSVIFG